MGSREVVDRGLNRSKKETFIYRHTKECSPVNPTYNKREFLGWLMNMGCVGSAHLCYIYLLVHEMNEGVDQSLFVHVVCM